MANRPEAILFRPQAGQADLDATRKPSPKIDETWAGRGIRPQGFTTTRGRRGVARGVANVRQSAIVVNDPSIFARRTGQALPAAIRAALMRRNATQKILYKSVM
jgi:hypothetical protein